MASRANRCKRRCVRRLQLHQPFYSGAEAELASNLLAAHSHEMYLIWFLLSLFIVTMVIRLR